MTNDQAVASTAVNRQTFIDSLISFMQKYGLDGVDIDWEYPAANDRGGIPADTDNFVLLMSEIQEEFARTNPGWEATITVPTSYWYLRGFDISRLQKYVSWFNVMSYDLVNLEMVKRVCERVLTSPCSTVCGIETTASRVHTCKDIPMFPRSIWG